LRTQMPKWHAAQKRRTQEVAELARRFGPEGAIKQQSSDPVDLDAEEFSNLERNVFLISRHIGLLRQHEFFPDFEKEGILIHESLEHWINAAQDIQTIFSSREAPRRLQGDIERAFGHLTICLAFKSKGVSLHLRPENTQAALIYHAAQMIAGGTTFQTCENCGTSFLGGRAGRGTKKGEPERAFAAISVGGRITTKFVRRHRQSPGRRFSPAKNQLSTNRQTSNSRHAPRWHVC
jgi:hypothetical protein